MHIIFFKNCKHDSMAKGIEVVLVQLVQCLTNLKKDIKKDT